MARRYLRLGIDRQSSGWKVVERESVAPPAPIALQYGYYFWGWNQKLSCELLSIQPGWRQGELRFRETGAVQGVKVSRLHTHLRLDFHYRPQQSYAAVALVCISGHAPVEEREFLVGSFLAIRSDIQVGSAALLLRRLGKKSTAQALADLQEPNPGLPQIEQYLRGRRHQTTHAEIRTSADLLRLAETAAE